MKNKFNKYFIVALIGLIVDFSILAFTKEVLGIHYLIAAACGFIGGLTVNYILSIRYVFSNPKLSSTKINFVLFALIGLAGLGLLNVLMYVFVGIVGANYLLAKTIATTVVYFWNYLARSYLYSD